VARNIRRKPGRASNPRIGNFVENGGARVGLATCMIYMVVLAIALWNKAWVPALLGAVGAAAAPFLTPVAWKIGNTLRKSTAPDAVITGGMGETLKQRIFWLVGPQLIACAVLNLPVLIFMLVSVNR
jgi:hypothetical protein